MASAEPTNGNNLKINVPVGKVGLILGKNGSTISKICLKTGAKVYFDQDDEDEIGSQFRTLIIEGKAEKAANAVKEVKTLLEKPIQKTTSARPIKVEEVDQTKRFILPTAYDNEGKSYVIIDGAQKQAFRAIQEMLAEARKSKLVFDEEETVEFEVPMDKIGLVFGPKHAVKMQIEKDTGAKIELKKAELPSNIFLIQGTPFQIHQAKHQIAIKAQQIPKDSPLPAFVAPPPKTFQCNVCYENFPLHDGVACVDRNEESEEKHSFCIECIQNQARAAVDVVDSTKLAKGGIGLPCMEHECTNALMLSEIRWHLNEAVLDLLDERCMHESIIEANIEGLVRCDNCANMLIIESGSNFTCPECRRIQCRYCPREYNEEHFGKTCKQVEEAEQERIRKQIEEAERERLRAQAAEAAVEADRKAKLNLYNQLSDIIVHRCHRCYIQFVKSDGCNKMTCRCGATQCYLCRASDIGYEHFCQYSLHFI
uniref:RING-type domain-containing protein n=1 Tax=Acrobeloides nanus TaxID=290746 RepID=A0A914D0G7_9BILA